MIINQGFTFTTSDVVTKVRELAAERPEFIYPGEVCSNITHNGCEACLIGQALQALGVPEVWFLNTPLMSQAGVRSVVLALQIQVIDERHIEWLQDVQSKQDAHRMWSDAVRLADHLQEKRDEIRAERV